MISESTMDTTNNSRPPRQLFYVNCVLLFTILALIPYNVLQAYLLVLEPRLFENYSKYSVVYVVFGLVNVTWAVICWPTVVELLEEGSRWPFFANAALNACKIVFNAVFIAKFNVWFQIFTIMLEIALEIALYLRIRLTRTVNNYVIYI